METVMNVERTVRIKDVPYYETRPQILVEDFAVVPTRSPREQNAVAWAGSLQRAIELAQEWSLALNTPCGVLRVRHELIARAGEPIPR